MQKIELHPTSLLAGAVLAVVAFVAMAPTPPPPSTVPTSPCGLVPGTAMVQIKEGVPYVVPTGRVLVLTGLGSTIGNNSQAVLYVNGAAEAVENVNVGTGSTCSVHDVPIGFSIPAGAVVTVTATPTGQGLGRAWGYLDRT